MQYILIVSILYMLIVSILYILIVCILVSWWIYLNCRIKKEL